MRFLIKSDKKVKFLKYDKIDKIDKGKRGVQEEDYKLIVIYGDSVT